MDERLRSIDHYPNTPTWIHTQCHIECSGSEHLMAGSFHFCSYAFFSHLAHIFSVFVVVLLCVLTFLVPCYDVRYDFIIKTKSLPPVVCWRVHVLLCVCVCLCIVVSNILLFLVVLAFCVVLCFFFFFYCFCLLPVSCGHNGTDFSGLSIIDCPFGFRLFLYFYISP